jgi:hypothetical protein
MTSEVTEGSGLYFASSQSFVDCFSGLSSASTTVIDATDNDINRLGKLHE